MAFEKMPRYMISLLFDLETAFIESDRLLSPMRNNKRWHQESNFTTTTDSSGACTDGMVDAIKAHTVHTDHFNAHHGGGADTINFCIEIQDFDYEGDGFLTDGIKYAIPFHQHDSSNEIVDCYDDCDESAGRCDFCDHEGSPGYCCPFVASLDDFQCIDYHNDGELFEAINAHYKNLNHLFTHHRNVPFHTCVAMNCEGVEIIGVDCTSDFKLHLTGKYQVLFDSDVN